MNNDFWDVIFVFLVVACLICATAFVSLLVKAVFTL